MWIDYISYFFGGIFLANTIPHLVAGVMGEAFQSPFAKPSGKGLSSSKVNVLWGFFNLVVAYVLIVQVGVFDLHDVCDVAATGAGILLISLFAAGHFGEFHGGNIKSKS